MNALHTFKILLPVCCLFPWGTAKAQSSPNFYALPDQGNAWSNRVNLYWSQPSELNTDHFELQRASLLDTTEFFTFQTLTAQGAQASNYAFQDNATNGEINYYRLKTVTKGGDAFFSPVVAVDLRDRHALTLLPSFLHRGGTLHLNMNMQPSEPLTVNFFDEHGRLMASYLVHDSYFVINTSGWSKGIYIYHISGATHPQVSEGKIMVM